MAMQEVRSDERMNLSFFVAKYTIYDGAHEYGVGFILRTTNKEHAYELALAEEHDEATCIKDIPDTKHHWDFGDNTTRSKLDDIRQISEEQAQMLHDLGIAYFI